MKIAVIGSGRMGRAAEAACARDAAIEIAGFVSPKGYGSLDEIADVDAVIDFSAPDASMQALSCAMKRKLPMVIGTTGFDSAQGDMIRTASDTIPIVWSSNFSAGVTVLTRLVREAAKALEGFDIEIVETHHREKLDAPSGTARMLLGAADPDGRLEAVFGRAGSGRRGREIGVHALRGGTAAGEHSVRFLGAQEELELRHRAESPEIFVRGALMAAQFARKAGPGLYDMDDVLFGGL